MARSGIRVYYALLTGDKKIPLDDIEKTKVKEFLNWIFSTRSPTMIWYSHKKTRYVLRLLKKRGRKLINMDTQDKRGYKFQENMSQTQGLSGQENSRNFLSANYMTQQKTPENGPPSSN